jgi:hypothetical protein
VYCVNAPVLGYHVAKFRNFSVVPRLAAGVFKPNPAAPSDRQNGTVKWFNDEKGYGFVTPENGSANLFVRLSAAKSVGQPWSLSFHGIRPLRPQTFAHPVLV